MAKTVDVCTTCCGWFGIEILSCNFVSSGDACEYCDDLTERPSYTPLVLNPVVVAKVKEEDLKLKQPRKEA